MSNWTQNNIPNLTGRIAIVTGANSGLGYETTRLLAAKGAHIVMAVRNMSKGESARDDVLKETPDASLELMALDLGSLGSVREFAQAYLAKYDHLHMLFNNAGIMAIPRRETEDGFEMQFGVNHLGHFALTGLLLPAILNTPDARVVTTTSTAQHTGDVNFDDLMGEESYSRYGAYSQSKLANVLFAFELQRRFEQAGVDAQSFTAQPGLANTELQKNTVASSGNPVERVVYSIVMPLMSQSAEMGALAQIRPAVEPGAKGGTYYTPARFNVVGYPVERKADPKGYDLARARKLWEISEQLTGVTYEALERQPVAV